MSLSSHKINGPQGAGALVLDKRVDIQPLLYGGGQEKGLRSGTENVAAIVGFGAACELIRNELVQRTGAIRQLRDRLEEGLKHLGADIFGSDVERLPNTSFFAFDGIEGETLVMALDRKGFAVASGSACSSDSTEPSHVLLAMGVDRDLARGAVRVSLGSGNSREQIEAFLLTLENELSRLRKLTAVAV
jgi:cysteine desulfurase